jgi:IS1 family transposase
MLSRSTTRWWLFPPFTREVQCDEKWAFVAKKQNRCRDEEPADAQRGDNGDHVAYDPEHRLVLTVVPGKRTAANVRLLVADFRRRTGGRILDLITTDDYGPYRQAIGYAYGRPWVPPVRRDPRGRPVRTYRVPPPELNYAIVQKTRRHGRVVGIERRVVLGEPAAVQAALERSRVSRQINTALLERQHATDRHRNARKRRQSYCFSKDWDVHNAATYFSLYSYNFCWPVRTLRIRGADGHWHPRTPAMAAGLADHVWSLAEWVTFPAAQPP